MKVLVSELVQMKVLVSELVQMKVLVSELELALGVMMSPRLNHQNHNLLCQMEYILNHSIHILHHNCSHQDYDHPLPLYSPPKDHNNWAKVHSPTSNNHILQSCLHNLYLHKLAHYNYYQGHILFLEHNYTQADNSLLHNRYSVCFLDKA